MVLRAVSLKQMSSASTPPAVTRERNTYTLVQYLLVDGIPWHEVLSTEGVPLSFEYGSRRF